MKKVPTSEIGIATIGITAARQVCRNSTITRTDEDDRLENGLDHRVDRLTDELGRVVDDRVGHSFRKILRKFGGGLADRIAGRKRIGARPLEHGERDRGIAAEIRGRGIILPRQFYARDILDAHHRILGLLDDDIRELGRIRQPAERSHRDLESELVGHRRLIQNAGGDLDILTLQGQRHIRRGQLKRLQTVGIEPDLHREIARAEHGDRADAVKPRQHVLDLQVRVIGQEDRHRATGRANTD